MAFQSDKLVSLTSGPNMVKEGIPISMVWYHVIACETGCLCWNFSHSVLEATSFLFPLNSILHELKFPYEHILLVVFQAGRKKSNKKFLVSINFAAIYTFLLKHEFIA